MLDALVERAAAQKQRLELHRVHTGDRDHRADQAVVPESIADLDDQRLHVVRAQEHREVGLRAPARRRVELVGALGQLCDACEVRRLHRPDPDVELQRREK